MGPRSCLGAEIEKIDEKRARIDEILVELKRLGQEADEGDDVKYEAHPEEYPERVLKVDDSEVKAEKFVSEEERERLIT